MSAGRIPSLLIVTPYCSIQ